MSSTDPIGTCCGGASLLCEALELIDGDRQNDYGDFGAEAVKLAAGFSALAGFTISPDTVPLMLMWLKMVRQAHKHKRDNLVDLVGYAELLARMQSEGLAQIAVEEAAEDGGCAGCQGCATCEGKPAKTRQTRQTRVYIAGPYSKGDRQANTDAAMKAANELIDAGYWPYVPHWTHYLDLIQPRTYDFWMAYDSPMVDFCDAVLRLPGESNGADCEEAHAASDGKPVFHSICDLEAQLPLTC